MQVLRMSWCVNNFEIWNDIRHIRYKKKKIVKSFFFWRKTGQKDVRDLCHSLEIERKTEVFLTAKFFVRSPYMHPIYWSSSLGTHLLSCKYRWPLLFALFCSKIALRHLWITPRIILWYNGSKVCFADLDQGSKMIKKKIFWQLFIANVVFRVCWGNIEHWLELKFEPP